jgi:hypothetical protein
MRRLCWVKSRSTQRNPNTLYARLETTARRRGFQTVEQLLEAWQNAEDALHQRQLAVQQIDVVREHLGLQTDSTELLREDRRR